MPRRREVPKREILPDPKFGNVELAKFMNVIMQRGKKAVAERIVYGALEHIEKKSGGNPLELFQTAMGNVKPMVEVKSRRVGGANYKCRWRFARYDAKLWPCAGSKRPPKNAAKNPWRNAWPTSCWRPPRAVAAP